MGYLSGYDGLSVEQAENRIKALIVNIDIADLNSRILAVTNSDDASRIDELKEERQTLFDKLHRVHAELVKIMN